jgi:hypothetical protein
MGNDKQPVVIRKWKSTFGDGLIALLPEDPANCSGTECTAYEQVGGHGAADIDTVLARTSPCRDAFRLCSLLNHLHEIGYKNLELHERVTPAMNVKRQENAVKYYLALVDNPLKQIQEVTAKE